MGEVVRGRKTRTVKSACKEDGIATGSCKLDSSLTDLILQPKSNKIARPPNAFMLFAREHRKALAIKYPDQTNKVISSMLGKCWQKLDPSSKAQYYTKAKMMQQLHKQKYPGYVYSPRLARIRKLEKRSNRKFKNPSKEVRLKCNEQGDNNIVSGENAGGEAGVELKPSSPGYIPNNPLFFSDVKTEPNSAEPEPTPQLTTNHQVCHSGEWISPPRFPPSTSGRSPEEYGIKPASYPETFYHRQTMPSACRCEACDEHRASYCYAPPMHPRWTSHEMDYVKEYADPSFYRSKYSGLPSYKSPLFSRYQHYPPSLSHETIPPYQYKCGPFQECKSDFCTLPTPYMKWKISQEDHARTYYRNMEDCYNHAPGLSAESRFRVIRPTSPTCDYSSHFDAIPRQRQVTHCGVYVDEPHLQDLDSSNIPRGQKIHSVIGSNEDLSSQKVEGSHFEMNVDMPQFITDTDQAYCRGSGSNDFSQSDHSYVGEPNSTEQNQNLQKIDTRYLQTNEINPQVSYVNSCELESNNQCESEGTTTYVSYGSEGFCSQGFEYENAYHSDDEIINVVDVVEEIIQNNSAVVKEELQLDDQPVSDNEPFIQRD